MRFGEEIVKPLVEERKVYGLERHTRGSEGIKLGEYV